MSKMVAAEIPGREGLQIQLDDHENLVCISAVGPLSFVRMIKELETQFKGASVKNIVLPSGTDIGAHLLREALLKARNEWAPPFAEEELCHCRGISRDSVVWSIYLGARSPEKISRWTSASTACGTCRPDVEALIAYFLDFSEGRVDSGN